MINVFVDIPITGHGDFHLKIDALDLQEVADTYFFAIDHGFMPDIENGRKVIISIRNLLKSWKDGIEKLLIKEHIFLPFDFSDQYLGCLYVQKIDDSCRICYGYTTEDTGVSILPSKGVVAIENGKFLIKTNTVEIDTVTLLNDIDKSIENLPNIL